MYDAAAALRDAMIELGLACDGGKDSLSMAAAAGGEVGRQCPCCIFIMGFPVLVIGELVGPTTPSAVCVIVPEAHWQVSWHDHRDAGVC